MKKLVVHITYSGKNFGAYIPLLPGCVATAKTPEMVKKNIFKAINFHIKGSIKDADPLPKFILSGKYEMVYLFDAISLLNYYKGIFTKSALMRITGINQQLLHHYANGLKTPRSAQVKKIATALHQLGTELLAIEM